MRNLNKTEAVLKKSVAYKKASSLFLKNKTVQFLEAQNLLQHLIASYFQNLVVGFC